MIPSNAIHANFLNLHIIYSLQVRAPRLHFGLRRGRLGLHNERERPEHVPDVQGFPA